MKLKRGLLLIALLGLIGALTLPAVAHTRGELKVASVRWVTNPLADEPEIYYDNDDFIPEPVKGIVIAPRGEERTDSASSASRSAVTRQALGTTAAGSGMTFGGSVGGALATPADESARMEEAVREARRSLDGR